MLGLNQCSFAFTSSDPVIQYYKVCKTCSKDGEVKVCLNCSSICHDGHDLGMLLREKFCCRCHETCQCRTFRQFESSSSSSKKRKAGDDRKIAVWSQFMSNSRSILSIHTDIEEANEAVKSAFVNENPWRYAETSLKSRASYQGELRKDTRLAHYSVICKENEAWVVAADCMDDFMQMLETGSSSSAGVPPSISIDTEHTTSASATKAKRMKVPTSPPPVHVTAGQHGQDNELIVLDVNSKSAEKNRKPKPPKDPNAPKQPNSAYLYFSNHYREKIKADQTIKEEKNPRPKEIMKIAGEKWKTLSNEEKEPYAELAAQDKLRYAREMEEYKATKQAQPLVADQVVEALNSIASSKKNAYDPSDSHSIEFKDDKDNYGDADEDMDYDPKATKKLTFQHTATSADDTQDISYVVWSCYHPVQDKLVQNLIKKTKTKGEANAFARNYFHTKGQAWGMVVNSQPDISTDQRDGMLTLKSCDGKSEWIVSVVRERDYHPPLTQGADHDGNEGEDEDQ